MKKLCDNLNYKKLKDLNPENLISASDGLIILERGLTFLKNVKITGKAASADHKAAGEFPHTITEIIEEKGYLPEEILSRHNSPFWKKVLQMLFISKGENGGSGFKAGRNRLTLLFCENAVLICPVLICNAQNPMCSTLAASKWSACMHAKLL